MPNTLGHIGAQVLLTRPAWRSIEPRWILVGCVVPDVPWILQRAVRTILPGVDPYELRTYAVTQGSLACTLLLCAAIAAVARRPLAVFGLLATNVVVHLLLDGMQSSWGNGVHLLAPFSWEPLSLGLFWPESPWTVALTAIGLAAAWIVFVRRPRTVSESLDPSPRTIALALALLLAYLVAPWTLRSGPVEADSHSLGTLRPGVERAGRPLELERVAFDRGPSGAFVSTLRKRIPVVSGGPDRSGIVSLRGHFDEDGRLAIETSHLHAGRIRDYASYVGLTLVALAWLPRRRRT